MIAELLRLQREKYAAFEVIRRCDSMSNDAIDRACDAYKKAHDRHLAAVLRQQTR